MSKKRIQYFSEFKAKLALAAIRGDETIPQLATRYGMRTTQINSWKRQLIEQAAELFSRSARRLSENRLIYCGRAWLAGFSDPFR